jgi:hypothetical protein
MVLDYLFLSDPGWHTFVLHTRDYREFCRRVAGRFIDHGGCHDDPPPGS